MTFSEWLTTQPRGALMRVEREVACSHTTLWRIQGGKPVTSYKLARKISDATGGAVSVDELCAPVQASVAE